MKNNRSFLKKAVIAALIIAGVVLIGSLISKSQNAASQKTLFEKVQETPAVVDLSAIPAYSKDLYVELNGNKPFFDASSLEAVPYEYYSPLDKAGRCGPAFAICCRETMPGPGERENISSIRPTGWQDTEYPFIPDGNLYNRSHLIARSLTAEEANEKNLITGTQQMNQDGMNPFEIAAARYIDDTGNHVAYRVTPVFENDNAVASGVIMEAVSLEDGGKGVCFNVYVYNTQPYVKIDYGTGNSEPDEKALSGRETDPAMESATYIINKNSMTFHKKDCAVLPKEKNRIYTEKSYEELVAEGCKPHKDCLPSP